MHAGHGDQVGALALVEVVQVRPGLEVVGVQAFLRDLHVRLHVVGEHLHFEVDAFLRQGRLDQFEDLGVGHRRGGHHQFLVGIDRGAEGGGEGSQKQQFFHRSVLVGLAVRLRPDGVSAGREMVSAPRGVG
ncbi:hypothetical protein D9M71_359790 [compost metagenome]